MHRAANWVLASVVGCGVLGGSSSTLIGQQRGDTIVFLVHASDPQPAPPARPNDALLYTGRTIGFVDATGCEGGSFPLQRAVLVDRDATGAPLNLEVITISHVDPVAPGTRVRLLSFVRDCFIGGVPYNVYQGTAD